MFTFMKYECSHILKSHAIPFVVRNFNLIIRIFFGLTFYERPILEKTRMIPNIKEKGIKEQLEESASRNGQGESGRMNS